jgi:SAM-dependent methyltransferase
LREHLDTVFEGVLNCTNQGCQLEYPIIDGIPILMTNVREYVNNNFAHIVERDDLPEMLESILGDSAGAESLFQRTRQHLSTYAWDAYADLDPAENNAVQSPSDVIPGAVRRCLEAGLELLQDRVAGPVIDMGCAVGRSTFELARQYDQPVLGVDVNFSMLRHAQRVLHEGRVSYPRRRLGLVYDRRDFTVEFESAGQVDFWACDAQNLPFADRSFGLAVGLQLLDAVASPVALLQTISRMLKPGGSAILATPYDWSPQVTSLEAWIGGHSQRGEHRGSAEPVLRTLLTPGAHPQSLPDLKLDRELLDVPWHTRVHDRSAMNYSVHLFTARKTSGRRAS